MQVTFHTLVRSDIPICLNIMKENYSNDTSWEELLPKELSEITQNQGNCLVAILDKVIIGFGCYIKFPEQSTSSHNIYALSWLNILPQYKGKGIGKLLVLELEKYIGTRSKIPFYVSLQTVIPAFYEKLGYQTFRSEDGIDFMRKYFSKSKQPIKSKRP